MQIDWKSKKYLCIDDFSAFRKTVKRMLESFGAKDVDDVGSGEEAIALAERKGYDIVICDYNLGPGKKDGQQILEEMKHRELLRPSSVFVMITAENTMIMVMGALEYQPDAYLIKPFVPEVLKRRLQSLVESRADMEAIEKAIRKKDYLAAIRLCDQKLETEPPNALEILRLKGGLCISIGKYEEARTLFNQVLYERFIPWASLGLGKTMFFTGQYEEARDVFEDLIMKNKTFMEAYDWLSKTLNKLGDSRMAIEILKRATEISPKAILRQKALGELCLKANDMNTAEEAFKAAVHLGQNSCFKSAADHVGLAKVYVQRGKPERALEVTKQARTEFAAKPEAKVQVAAMDGFIYQAMNQPDEAKKAIHEAGELMDGTVSKRLPIETTLEIAKAFLTLGEPELGIKIAQTVIQNNHEDQGVITGVQRLFDDAKMGDEGRKLIESSTREVVTLNNSGVKLVEDGKLGESIDYFEKAVEKLPGNKIINANAAHALLLYMKKNGLDREKLRKAKNYLDQARTLDPSYKKYRDLLPLYQQLAEQAETASSETT